jgi:hypothetical protein
MNEKLKNKWVKALRSKAYKQGRFVLRDNENCFCAIGVLCNIYSLGIWELKAHGWNYKEKRPKDFRLMYITKYSETNYLLNSEDLEAMGLRKEDQEMIMNLNDKEGRSFSAIADYIESHF